MKVLGNQSNTKFSLSTNGDQYAVTKVSNHTNYNDLKTPAEKFAHIKELERMLLAYHTGRHPSQAKNDILLSGSDKESRIILKALCGLHKLTFQCEPETKEQADGNLLTMIEKACHEEFNQHKSFFHKFEFTPAPIGGNMPPPMLMVVNGPQKMQRQIIYKELPQQTPIVYEALPAENYDQLSQGKQYQGYVSAKGAEQQDIEELPQKNVDIDIAVSKSNVQTHHVTLQKSVIEREKNYLELPGEDKQKGQVESIEKGDKTYTKKEKLSVRQSNIGIQGSWKREEKASSRQMRMMIRKIRLIGQMTRNLWIWMMWTR